MSATRQDQKKKLWMIPMVVVMIIVVLFNGYRAGFFPFHEKVITENTIPVMIVRSVIMNVLVLFVFCHLIFGIRSFYQWLFKYRFWLCAAIIIFGTILSISGSSISHWSSLFGQSDTGIAFGQTRPIRSDEWRVFTPLMLSQGESGVPFSWYSDILRGTLTDVFVVYGLPIRSFLMLFRPFQLGFLFLGERGLAFFWCARTVCLWISSFELFRIMTGDKRRISAAGATLLLFSPALQWWFAINGLVEMIVFGNLCIISFYYFLRSESIRIRLLCVFGMFWGAGGFIFTLYPSWMIPLAYGYLALAIWVFVERRKQIVWRKTDIAMLVSAILLLGLCGLYFLSKSGDAIKAVANTVYPGSRFEVGGNNGLRFFLYPGSVFFPWRQDNVVANVCESATIYGLFPMGLVLSAFAFRKKRDPGLIIMLIFAVFVGAYCVVGFPAFLAKISLLSRSQAPRAFLGVDFLNLLILIRALGILADSPSYETTENKGHLFRQTLVKILLAAALALVMMFASSRRVMPLYYSKPMLAGAFLILLTGFLLALFISRLQTGFLVYAALIAVMCGITVNPVQVGLNELYEQDLGKMISSEVDQDPDAKWIVANIGGQPVENYPLIFGASTINSTNIYPDMDRWEMIDEGLIEDEVYNRYAHISVDIVRDTNPDEQFILQSADAFHVSLDNDDVQELGIRYVLSSDRMEAYSDDEVRYEKLMEQGALRVYHVAYE